MLKNYLITALRNLRKHTFYTLLNAAGLALGITCCLLITLYVLDELSYDRYHQNAGRIYRINSDIKFGGNAQQLAVTSDPMGATLVNDYPQVLSAVRFREQGGFLVRKDNESFRESRVIFADSTLFDVFTFSVLAGNPRTALNGPGAVVISESAARKYFGSADAAMNQTLRFDDRDDYLITAVIGDMPQNSHFRFDFFLSMASLEESKQNNWLSHNFNTYLLLHPDADPAAVEAVFPEVIEKYVGPQAKQLMNITIEEFRQSGNYIDYHLIPLTDIHLRSDRIAELAPNGNIQYVYIFSAIALFILLIACVNFMNLATARSAGRAKEVGVRKVLGSHRSGLISQFLTESILLSVIAFGLAVVASTVLLPFFNQLAGKAIAPNALYSPGLLLALVAASVVVGLLAGLYPAVFLSAFQPIQVLKGTFSTGAHSRSRFRQGLVVFQFITSILLIISTMVIYRQLTFIRTKKLGFTKEQVLVVNDAYALGKQTEAFKNEALRAPGIVNATVSGYLPVPSSRSDMPFFPEGVIQQEKAVTMQYWPVDHEYIQTMGMEIIAGRDFSRQLATDSAGIIINESAARLFGYTDPVGKKIWTFDDMGNQTTVQYTIIGVVKNFHFASLRQNIGALCLTLGRSTAHISFRMSTDNIGAVVSTLERQWKAMAPGQPFSYSFLDESFNAMYRTEQRVGQIAITFSVLAVCIACLGLFGLAAYTAEQRTKEIGIRKVLGASVGQLVALLSADFLKLVLIAFVIAVPIAGYIMHRWLEDFAYRIALEWWVFGLAGLAALLIAFLTVSLQSVKAALTNPVKSLRSE